MADEVFEIAGRFCGPPRSGNGGYVAGRIARHISGSASIRLKAPPPLSTPLRIAVATQGVSLFADETLIAEGRSAPLELSPPKPPSFDFARAASRSFLGFRSHPFPGCFVCGPARAEQDGLRIFPGTMDGGKTLAAPWIPDATLVAEDGDVAPEFVWAALDCTGGFAIFPAPAGSALVLGELSAQVLSPLRAGERCVVLGWPLGDDGRRRFAGSALYGADQRLIAFARAVWIQVPLSAWA
ncbi:MAG: hypothetical protein JNJ44_07805 [Zoogloeaceae bacterium]|nr:hypothetical protein [Zoogloeaceae bacterium]